MTTVQIPIRRLANPRCRLSTAACLPAHAHRRIAATAARMVHRYGSFPRPEPCAKLFGVSRDDNYQKAIGHLRFG